MLFILILLRKTCLITLVCPFIPYVTGRLPKIEVNDKPVFMGLTCVLNSDSHTVTGFLKLYNRNVFIA